MDLLDTLDKIHSKVSTGFNYKSDNEMYGVLEKWMMPTDALNISGDCEDFALGCRVLCRYEKLNSRLVICKTKEGKWHCVLEVEGWILDNEYTYVVSKDDLDYEWHSISGFKAGEDWHVIKES